MPTHPLWLPFVLPTTEEMDRAAVTGQRAKIPNQRVEVVAPDPTWPATYRTLEANVQGALGDGALHIEHVGSTSVPELWAKPVIDLDLIVADSADEDAYVPLLEAAGWRLVIREPDWMQHRCFRHTNPAANLHAFSPDAVEPKRQVAFRDWLIAHDDDRQRYGELKRQLAAQPFGSVMEYNNHKAPLIYDIYERIFAADPAHPHTPQPR